MSSQNERIVETASEVTPASRRGKRRPVAAVDPLRALPADDAAERAALSCMLLDPDACLGEVMGSLKPAAFHSPAHREIYATMVDLKDKKQKIDLVTVTSKLHDKGTLGDVGGAPYVTELLDYVPTIALFDQYIEILRGKQVLRAIITSCTECVTRAHEEQDDVAGLLDTVEKDILEIREGGQGEKDFVLKTVVMDTVGDFDKMMRNRGQISGLATGFADLDRMTDGLHGQELIIIAARPSMGKTSFAMNVVEHVACDLNKNVLVFSLEMSARQLVQRLVCTRAGVSMQRFREGVASRGDFARIVETAKDLATKKLIIDDTASISILELRAKARRVNQKYPLDLIAVDYLQLMRSTTKRAQENRQQEIAEISSGLKALAKEMNLPVLVLAQLNRKPDDRGDGKPRLSDLRESGSIEQDADVVGLLTREGYYGKKDEDSEEKSKKATLIIAKQRNGPTDDVPLVFLDEIMAFRTAARHQD